MNNKIPDEIEISENPQQEIEQSEYGDGFDRGYAHGHASGYSQGRYDQLIELLQEVKDEQR